jgi:hypothetical protein
MPGGSFFRSGLYHSSIDELWLSALLEAPVGLNKINPIRVLNSMES